MLKIIKDIIRVVTKSERRQTKIILKKSPQNWDKLTLYNKRHSK
jgi:hypothetical protein